MSKNIGQLNEEVIKGQIKELVRGSFGCMEEDGCSCFLDMNCSPSLCISRALFSPSYSCAAAANSCALTCMLCARTPASNFSFSVGSRLPHM